jgi:hypothetical protein
MTYYRRFPLEVLWKEILFMNPSRFRILREIPDVTTNLTTIHTRQCVSIMREDKSLEDWTNSMLRVYQLYLRPWTLSKTTLV